jgi:hypothetical protein
LWKRTRNYRCFERSQNGAGMLRLRGRLFKGGTTMNRCPWKSGRLCRRVFARNRAPPQWCKRHSSLSTRGGRMSTMGSQSPLQKVRVLFRSPATRSNRMKEKSRLRTLTGRVMTHAAPWMFYRQRADDDPALQRRTWPERFTVLRLFARKRTAVQFLGEAGNVFLTRTGSVTSGNLHMFVTIRIQVAS